MTQTIPFGQRTWNLDLQIAGARTREQFCEDLEHLVKFLGMDRADMLPDVRAYPLPDGRGGVGLTLMQPYVEPRLTVHQPLTTSFAVIDSWPGHFTLTIKSCLWFSAEAVMQWALRRFGPHTILDAHSWALGQARRPSRAMCGGGGG